MRRVLYFLFATLGPGTLAWYTLCYFAMVLRWILLTVPDHGWWPLLLALPPLVAEIGFTLAFEVRIRGWVVGVLIGLAGRLLFLLFMAHTFVLRAIQVRGTANNVIPQLGRAPEVLKITWLASPVFATVLLTACLGVYLYWTAMRCKGRYTTTVLLPSVASCLLFGLMYELPEVSLDESLHRRPEFVKRIWKPTNPDQRYPREVYVTPDESSAVVGFGSGLELRTTDAPPNELELPGCTPGECRRNLALLNLKTGGTQSYAMKHLRRFFSECGGPVFLTPQYTPFMLELRLDGSILKHPLPATLGSERLDELIYAYRACDRGLVYIASNHNPAILAADARSGEVVDSVELAGWNGIMKTDSMHDMARNTTRFLLYVLMFGSHRQLAEIAEEGLRPLRAVELPGEGVDLAVSPNGETIFVSSLLSPEIWRLDAETLKVTAVLKAPTMCRRVAVSPDGKLLFAASYLNGELHVYDAGSGRKLLSFWVAPKLDGMIIAGKGVYLLSATGLWRIALEDLAWRAGNGS